jgi:DNA-binding NtrC family response regulator
VDVRIIATTNRDLVRRVTEGQFRQDLYFRLSVLPIVIPPLRERRDDIPLLAQRFAKRTAAELGKDVHGLSPDTIAMLQRHDWPGNVRELQHAVERAVILSAEPVLQPSAFDGLRFGLGDAHSDFHDGSQPARAPGDGHPAGASEDGHPARAQLVSGSPALAADVVVLDSLNVAEAERQLVERALAVTNGNRTRAAELLGISIRTLRNKLNTNVQSS